jgi:hypothetical protein
LVVGYYINNVDVENNYVKGNVSANNSGTHTDPAGGNGGTTATSDPTGGNGGATGGTQVSVVPGKVEQSDDGKASYEVTGTTKDSEGKEIATVTYKASETGDSKAKVITVPEKVTLKDGTVAVVTGIAANAFAKAVNVEKVVLPATIKNINPTQYVFHEDTETCTPVYTTYFEDYDKFYRNAVKDVEDAKKNKKD